MQSQLISIGKLKNNSGQIEGLPKNPRLLKDDKFKKLVKSIKDDPEMLQLREVIAYELNNELIVIAGNMRLGACKELGIKEIPVKILSEDTSIEKLKAYTIKDNLGYGEWSWDDIANEWDMEQLEDWGMDLPLQSETEKLSLVEFENIYFEPTEKPNINLIDCIDTQLYDKKISEIEKSLLSQEQKNILKLFAQRFLKIDFENVANYYFFNASDDEQLIIERLRLVLTDNGINGFIEDDILKIHKTIDLWEQIL
jgi:hypothetical protein